MKKLCFVLVLLSAPALISACASRDGGMSDKEAKDISLYLREKNR